MLKTSQILLTDGLKKSLKTALPYLKSKSARDRIRESFLDGRIAYVELKKISAILLKDRRTKDLKVADFDLLLREAIFIFPESEGAAIEDCRRGLDEREYEKMLGLDRSFDDDGGGGGIRSFGPYLNLLFSTIVASIGVYLFWRHVLGRSVEFSIIWAVVAGLLFTILELYYIMHSHL